MNKLAFLQKEFPRLLSNIDPSTPPRWGKMNVQQMIEHFSDSVRIANGRDPKDCITPEENIPKMQAFMMSDKPFKENTPNPQMPETPLPCRWERIEDAVGELEQELNEFVDVFDQDKTKVITNPFFGDLNFEQWTQLLYKHAVHHLRQFGVSPEDVAVES